MSGLLGSPGLLPSLASLLGASVVRHSEWHSGCGKSGSMPAPGHTGHYLPKPCSVSLPLVLFLCSPMAALYLYFPWVFDYISVPLTHMPT
jgi:hypothetical protein